MGVNFFVDTSGCVRTKILDVEAMLPFAIDGFDLPATMVEIGEFGMGIRLRIVERRQQPTGAESRPLVAKQPCGDDVRQVGIFAAGARCGMEFNHPFVVTQRTPTLGITGLLIGDPEEEMCATQGHTPDGRVGKKSRGPSGPSRCAEGTA